MKAKLRWALVIGGVLGVLAVSSVTVLATSPVGVSLLPLAPVGHFGAINTKAKSADWRARIKTEGVSDMYVTQVTIQPGGTLGWHKHPGPSFVIVKSGTASFYQANDPSCTARTIPAGGTLFEPAGLIHIVRNEGNVPLVNVVVQLIPTGGPRLISEPSPGNCPF